MKPRHPNLEWIKKVLADLERDRGNPLIAALMDRQMGGHQTSELAEVSVHPVCSVRLMPELTDGASVRFKPWCVRLLS
jgi:hypothetical protein